MTHEAYYYNKEAVMSGACDDCYGCPSCINTPEGRDAIWDELYQKDIKNYKKKIKKLKKKIKKLKAKQ